MTLLIDTGAINHVTKYTPCAVWMDELLLSLSVAHQAHTVVQIKKLKEKLMYVFIFYSHSYHSQIPNSLRTVFEIWSFKDSQWLVWRQNIHLVSSVTSRPSTLVTPQFLLRKNNLWILNGVKLGLNEPILGNKIKRGCRTGRGNPRWHILRRKNHWWLFFCTEAGFTVTSDKKC